MSGKEIGVVLKENTKKLMALPGVVGTGHGLLDNESCIVVYVNSMSSDLEKKLPKQIDGYKVDIKITGEFRTLPQK